MFNPDKYRSVEWQKGGRDYPALDCFGIVNEIRRDLGPEHIAQLHSSLLPEKEKGGA